jgi:3-oxoadipate enol-lactonase
MANFKTSDGCAIDYTLYKAYKDGAPCLALIHSLALDRTIWDGVVGKFAASYRANNVDWFSVPHEYSTDDVNVLTYDCRGHGKSDKPASLYTVEQFAHDLAALFDHVGWDAAAVAGCSMGGMVAEAFGGLYPARAKGLGLIDTAAWYGAEAPKTWRERAAKARAGGLAGMVDFQTSRWFSDKFRAEHPELVKAAADVFLSNDIDAYAATCVLLGDADLRRFQSEFKMPVAIIVGEEDYATPLAMAHQMQEALPGSTLSILQKARHLTPIECADRVAAELRALLDRA